MSKSAKKQTNIISEDLIGRKAYELWLARQDDAEGDWNKAREILEKELAASKHPFNRLTKFFSKDRLERSSHGATIVASFVAIVSLIFGANQFSQTQVMQREALELERQFKLVELNNEYNKLQQESAEDTPASLQKISSVTANYNEQFWRDNLSISIAESIYNLSDDAEGEGWHTTVRSMILDHQDFIMKNPLECETYTEKFIGFVKKVLPQGSPVCKNE
ncbi:MAG: hypothetical protein LDL41_02785 [Coleofasciculus sp. S288]|nr:hypothetical protein [Coleofasciculus sp. S288]